MPDFTYDVSNLTGQVRLLSGDTDSTGLSRAGGDRTRTDTEIGALLTLEGRDVRLAAAQLLEGKAAEYASIASLTVQGGIRQDYRVRSTRLLEAAQLLRTQSGAPVVFNAALNANVLANNSNFEEGSPWL